MATSTVRFVVEFAIAEGRREAFERVSREMTALTQGEPGTLAYDWYVSADRTRVRLYESYRDADAVVAHLSGPVVQGLVPKLLETCSLTGFEVYGDPGPGGSSMLAGLGAQIFASWHAIER